MKKLAVALLVSSVVLPLGNARAYNPLAKLHDAIAAKNAREREEKHKDHDKDQDKSRDKDKEKPASRPSAPQPAPSLAPERPRSDGAKNNRPDNNRPEPPRDKDRDHDRPRNPGAPPNPNPPRDRDHDNHDRDDHNRDHDHDKDRDRPRTVIIERPVYVPSPPIYLPAPIYDPVAEQARREDALLEIVAKQMRYALRENPILKPYKLDTDTVGDSVEIHGIVDNFGQLQLALDVARNIDPRTRIVLTRIKIRNLAFAPNYPPPAYPPSYPPANNPAPNDLAPSYPPPANDAPANYSLEGNLPPC